jgi:hypothetical protein
MLWEQVQACWADIDQGYINKIIDSMFERVEAVRQARGEVTWFCKLDLVDIIYRTSSLLFDCCRLENTKMRPIFHFYMLICEGGHCARARRLLHATSTTIRTSSKFKLGTFSFRRATNMALLIDPPST